MKLAAAPEHRAFAVCNAELPPAPSGFPGQLLCDGRTFSLYRPRAGAFVNPDPTTLMLRCESCKAEWTLGAAAFAVVE